MVVPTGRTMSVCEDCLVFTQSQGWYWDQWSPGRGVSCPETNGLNDPGSACLLGAVWAVKGEIQEPYEGLGWLLSPCRDHPCSLGS